MYRRILIFFLLVSPLIGFTNPVNEKTEKYLSNLELEIKQDMNNTNNAQLKVTPSLKEQKESVITKLSPQGSFNSYFKTVEPKKHALVDFYIQYYSTFGKKKLEESLVRLQSYFPIIVKYANIEKLPLEVALIPLVENDAKLNYIHGDRAGMWLLPTSTAQIYNLRIDDYTDERLDIEKSTAAALKHFSSLKDAFNGDWELALTSFNGGGAYFHQKMRSLGIDDFWKLLEKDTEFDSDTLEYVPKFYALLTILKDPKYYNISVPVINTDEVGFTGITLTKSGVSFKDIAKLTNISTEEITNLNPQLSRQFTVKNVTMYVPANTKYLMTSRIRVAKATQLRYLPSGKNRSYTNNVTTSKSKTAVAKKKKSVKNSTLSSATYKVKANDTLFSIAKKYNISVNTLMDQNGLKQNSILQVGKVLKIKNNTSKAVAKKKKIDTKVKFTYTVKPGDTIYSIAKNYQVPMDKVTNHKNGHIQPGDKLMIVR